MPLFYFSVTADDAKTPETVSLPDTNAAHSHAVLRALELLWDSPYRLHAYPEWAVQVTDAEKNQLFVISLSDALGESQQSQRA